MVQRLQNGRRPSGLNNNIVSKTINWSRHKNSRMKEIIVEKFLQDELDLFRCCPCPLRDEIYMENYCDALRQVYNETSLREVDINHLLEISIASDIVGGEDFKGFLSRKADKRSLYNYELWAAIENFSYKYSTGSSRMFCARGYAMQVVGIFSEQESVSFDWSFKKNRMVNFPVNLETLEKEVHSLLYKFTHPDGSKFTDWDDPF